MSEHTTTPSSTVTTDAPHAVPIAVDLNHELAAVALAILDKEDARRDFNKEINTEIKKLKKRQRDLATEIKSGGRQIPISFYAAPDAKEEAPESDPDDLPKDDLGEVPPEFEDDDAAESETEH